MTEKYHQKWWRENKHKYKEKRKLYEEEYAKHNNNKRMFRHCKNRAKTKGIAFELDLSDFEQPEFCPILGKKLERCTPYAPSIDRIDPAKGYVKGNVQIISKLANVMKNNASPEDLRSFAQWVLKNY